MSNAEGMVQKKPTVRGFIEKYVNNGLNNILNSDMIYEIVKDFNKLEKNSKMIESEVSKISDTQSQLTVEKNVTRSPTKRTSSNSSTPKIRQNMTSDLLVRILSDNQSLKE